MIRIDSTVWSSDSITTTLGRACAAAARSGLAPGPPAPATASALVAPRLQKAAMKARPRDGASIGMRLPRPAIRAVPPPLRLVIRCDRNMDGAQPAAIRD